MKLRRLRSRMDDGGVRQYNEVRWQYLNLLEKQEIYWHQRAKQMWLQCGDQHTKFFHRYASFRKTNNYVKELQDKEWNWMKNEDQIQHIVVKYFEELFASTQVEEREFMPREVVQQMTREQNEQLMVSVTDVEVKAAVFSMCPEKSPGLDGLNPGSFQAFWNVVGVDVVKFCQQFFNTGQVLPKVNRTLVCLIPKVKRPKKTTELRPISLCNVLVRIVSKVMANRIKPFLKTLISDKQGAFVEGRLLTDNALLAFEINHCITRRS